MTNNKNQKSQYDSKGSLAFFQLAKFGKAFYLFDFAGFFPPQQYRTDRQLGGGLLALHAEGDEVGLIKHLRQEVEQRLYCALGCSHLKPLADFLFEFLAKDSHLRAERIFSHPLGKLANLLFVLAALHQVAEHTCAKAYHRSTAAEDISRMAVGIERLQTFVFLPSHDSC